MDWNKIKEIVAGMLLVGSLVFMLWLFINFWFRGSFYVGEPNLVVRSIETALIIGGLLLALERYLGDLEAIKKVKRRLFIKRREKSEREHEQDLPMSKG